MKINNSSAPFPFAVKCGNLFLSAVVSVATIISPSKAADEAPLKNSEVFDGSPQGFEFSVRSTQAVPAKPASKTSFCVTLERQRIVRVSIFYPTGECSELVVCSSFAGLREFFVHVDEKTKLKEVIKWMESCKELREVGILSGSSEPEKVDWSALLKVPQAEALSLSAKAGLTEWLENLCNFEKINKFKIIKLYLPEEIPESIKTFNFSKIKWLSELVLVPHNNQETGKLENWKVELARRYKLIVRVEKN